MKKIAFEEFRRIIAEELDVDDELVVPDAVFMEDLMADSIQLVEMMLHMEERGIVIPGEAAWKVRTVEDAYRIYEEQAEGKSSA